MWKCSLGAVREGEGREGEGREREGTRFTVWAPKRESVSVEIVAPEPRIIPMEKAGSGYFEIFIEGVKEGAKYFYLLDNETRRPDPASRFQPEGVHGASQVTGTEFPCKENKWKNIPLKDYIIYEVHVGAFTEEGTFDALASKIPYLIELGITAVEIMPVAQFPGTRNWGYDGVFPFAPQDTYGGPLGLKRLVDALHLNGLAAVLDVVYNHLGPEGNYLSEYGHYFSEKYKTPWGAAINYDDAFSDHVRRFFIENALYWFSEFHFDALRLDAVHGIYDFSAVTFLEELQERVEALSKELQKPLYLIAESDRNDARLISPRGKGGYGMAALWNEDFHHALHALLTGEREGYYMDYGSLDDMVKSLKEGFVYTGQYSRFRKRRHGSPSGHLPPSEFVVFSQNHDQVGNRFLGERLSSLVDMKKLKLAAAWVFLSPYVPLLFMGEEYGEVAPFLYFVSHTDPALAEAVREGRKKEFAAFVREGNIPDPEGEETFVASKLKSALLGEPSHKELFEFYKELIKLRKTLPALNISRREDIMVLKEKTAIIVIRKHESQEILFASNFGEHPVSISLPPPKARVPRHVNAWRVLIGSGLIKDSVISGKIEVEGFGILLCGKG